MERDMSKAELEDVDWRMVAQDRGQWRWVVHRAAETHLPLKSGKQGRERIKLRKNYDT